MLHFQFYVIYFTLRIIIYYPSEREEEYAYVGLVEILLLSIVHRARF